MTTRKLCMTMASWLILAIFIFSASQPLGASPVYAIQDAIDEAPPARPIIFWTGATSREWDDVTNWNPPLPPSGEVDCWISSASQYPLLAGTQGERTSYACGGSLFVDAMAEITIMNFSGLSSESAIIRGTVTMTAENHFNARQGIRIDLGGLISQLGAPSEGIKIEQGGALTVYGKLKSSADPFQIYSQPPYTADLQVMPGGEVEIGQGGILVVTGSVTNLGTMTETQLVLDEVYTPFLKITDGSATPLTKYYGLGIKSSDGDMGPTTVTIRGGQVCSPITNFTRQTVKRCFTISPTTVLPALVIFYYTQEESNKQPQPSAYRLNSSDWDLYPSSSGGAADSMYVMVDEIGSYGTFTLHDPSLFLRWTYLPLALR